jgi:hypothetical protein
MKKQRRYNPTNITTLSVLAILIPLFLQALWIYSFSSHEKHEESVDMYYSFFPEFFNRRYFIELLSISFSVLAIWLGGICWDRGNILQKITGAMVIIAGCLTVLLMVFSMM